jgi:hypothetical protein
MVGLPIGKDVTIIVATAMVVLSLLSACDHMAKVRRLGRESKVLATALALYRQFLLSNSAMLFDLKIVMVAAVFFGSKVEDATADVQNLEEGKAFCFGANGRLENLFKRRRPARSCYPIKNIN